MWPLLHLPFTVMPTVLHDDPDTLLLMNALALRRLVYCQLSGSLLHVNRSIPTVTCYPVSRRFASALRVLGFMFQGFLAGFPDYGVCVNPAKTSVSFAMAHPQQPGLLPRNTYEGRLPAVLEILPYPFDGTLPSPPEVFTNQLAVPSVTYNAHHQPRFLLVQKPSTDGPPMRPDAIPC